MAAVTKSSSSGSRTRLKSAAPIATCSANEPAWVNPGWVCSGQTCACPDRHHSQRPQPTTNGTVTRSPTATFETRRPAPAITPANSWPGTCGSDTGSCPRQACQSDRQTPVARTSMTTPSREQSGRATSTIRNGPPISSKATARTSHFYQPCSSRLRPPRERRQPDSAASNPQSSRNEVMTTVTPRNGQIGRRHPRGTQEPRLMSRRDPRSGARVRVRLPGTPVVVGLRDPLRRSVAVILRDGVAGDSTPAAGRQLSHVSRYSSVRPGHGSRPAPTVERGRRICLELQLPDATVAHHAGGEGDGRRRARWIVVPRTRARTHGVSRISLTAGRRTTNPHDEAAASPPETGDGAGTLFSQAERVSPSSSSRALSCRRKSGVSRTMLARLGRNGTPASAAAAKWAAPFDRGMLERWMH